ncbi:MAG: hypothetical protein HYS66_18930 [Deltaproteobacteria bacterium]|nr:hypothetical protein [Deltaproteobacteria bacterium]
MRGLYASWSPSPHSSPVKGEEVNNPGAIDKRGDLIKGILDRRSFVFLLVIIFVGALIGCKKAEPPVSDSEVKAGFEKTLPTTTDDPVWERAPLHPAKLLLQDMVEPRLMQGSTASVNVQAVTDGQRISFRLSWNDPTADDLPGPGRFGDAVAVQLPAATAPDVPSPQMGEEGKAVEITYWSAVFQAMVNGRKDDIQVIYPQATVDHYPAEAASLKAGSAAQQNMEKRYSPARSLGNPMAGPRKLPVQDLYAEGPGTIRLADKTISSGTGKRAKDGWIVLLSRPLPQGSQAGGRTQVAIAVWEGSHQEVGARKMRSAWIPLALGASR